ncbi:transcription factor btf3 [Rhizoctonia solani AG-1 IA]|uniref:Transcription factor btf3 n=1 Tax=Thanatephorus cucumeris (strain AG1-IA) TaxID=983506 RepID=L8WMP4_THACA|nr:transcription factor btf3 [Rhizoctonia solani AG-1 IA]
MALQPPLIHSTATSASSLAKHEELANKVAQDAPQPDSAQPVAHENQGKDIDEVNSPEGAAKDTSRQNGSAKYDWQLLCGPMLKYSRLSNDSTRWHGSALIVLRAPSESAARRPDQPSSSMDGPDSRTKPVHLFTERDRVYWRIDLETALGEEEREVRYSITLAGHRQQDKIERSFWVPKIGQTFRIMFFSKSMAWRSGMMFYDVCCAIIRATHYAHAPLEPWAQELSPRKRAKIPFPLELRDKVDDWYFQHHCDWFNASPFREANALCSKSDRWLQTTTILLMVSVRTGMLGNEHRYLWVSGKSHGNSRYHSGFDRISPNITCSMSLFQQHLPPSTTTNQLTYDPESFNPTPAHSTKPSHGVSEKSPIPTSRPEHPDALDQNGTAQNGDSSHEKPQRSEGTGEESELDPSYVRHPQQGPYIQHRGLSICTSLGEGVLFYGVSNGVASYQSNRHNDWSAYPRLVWAETLMTTRILTFEFSFDGKVELLDDLEDHWAAAVHKAERNHLVQRLQTLSYTKQVRITILSGDVHLAAIGRFFTKAKLDVAQEKDHRYMVNVISSAITNAPPPDAVADVLNARNKLHRLDHHTSENLMDIFEEGVDGSKRRVNKTCYPARNYCVITRADPAAGPDATTAEEIGDNPAAQEANEKQEPKTSPLGKVFRKDKDHGEEPKSAVDKGEISGGTGTIAKEVKGAQVGHDASALAPATGTKAVDALNISLRLEVDSKSPEGKTKAYGLSIPRLDR